MLKITNQVSSLIERILNELKKRDRDRVKNFMR
jgi:hypothetical protein